MAEFVIDMGAAVSGTSIFDAPDPAFDIRMMCGRFLNDLRPRRDPALLRRERAGALCTAALCLIATTGARAEAPTVRPPYALSLFTARMTGNNWEDFLVPNDIRFRHAYFAGLGLSRRIGSVFDGLDLELEGQAIRHFGAETQWEFNIAAVARWKRFPWNDVLPTSFAFGLGPSYATRTPPEERALNGSSRRLLAYWLAEVEVALPERAWSALVRIHHRSTAFGTFGARGGSNWLAVGLRYRF